MTKEELAAQLHGREYRHELTREEQAIAQAHGLVVIFGASDDLMEFRDTIHEKLDAWEGAEAYLTPHGLLQNECPDTCCPYYERLQEACTTRVRAVWWDEGEYAWTYETDLPHAVFDVMEDGKKYCQGIVLDLPREDKADAIHH